MEPENTSFESRQTESWFGGGDIRVVYRMKVGTRLIFGGSLRISFWCEGIALNC